MILRDSPLIVSIARLMVLDQNRSTKASITTAQRTTLISSLNAVTIPRLVTESRWSFVLNLSGQ
jgi:hypothetical protein